MIKRILSHIVSPVSANEDDARSEFILNVLLCAIVGLSGIAFIIDTLQAISNDKHSASAWISFFVICFFVALYVLSRNGHPKIASYCFLTVLFFLITNQIYNWGADLPSALLSYVVIIVMAGVLLNTRVAFIATILISASVVWIGYEQAHYHVVFNTYWKNESITIADVIVFVVLFLIIATVSWLSNREIERSLRRARASEVALKKERDSLEIKVEEKTRELKEAQADRISQLYRFAEFGRLSSGLFHDLINPLSAVSLNMEKLNGDQSTELTEAKAHVAHAVLATKKMEEMVGAVRRQLSREENNTKFSINSEISQVVDILKYKSAQENVKIKFSAEADGELFGDAIKFHHAILNLISNAIDSYAEIKHIHRTQPQVVQVVLEKKNSNFIICVRDFGTGISPENLDKIFEPFFTTKTVTRGMGIGLSMTKRIIEKDFLGTLHVESMKGKGAKFTIKIPVI